MRTYTRRYDYAEIRRLLTTTDLPCWQIAQTVGCSTSLVHQVSVGRTGRGTNEKEQRE